MIMASTYDQYGNFVYTSENIAATGYTITNLDNLVSGQTHKASRYEEIIDVGTYENVLALEIFDENELNVAFCYDIKYTYGTVTVTQRVIDIQTQSASKEYDGEPLFCKEYNVTSSYEAPNDFGIGPNDYIETLEYTELVHVGQVENILTFVIKNKEGKDVTSNYQYTLSYGTLEITDNDNKTDKPDAVITFDSLSKRVSYSSSKQIWTENDITVTNERTYYSSSVSSSYYPVYFRIYSKLKVDYIEGIKKLIIYCNSYKYNTFSVPNAKVTKNSYSYTIEFNDAVDEFVLSSLPFQLDVLKMEIYSESKMVEDPDNPSPNNPQLDTDGGLETPGIGNNSSSNSATASINSLRLISATSFKSSGISIIVGSSCCFLS